LLDVTLSQKTCAGITIIIIEGNDYETRPSSFLYVFCSFLALIVLKAH